MPVFWSLTVIMLVVSLVIIVWHLLFSSRVSTVISGKPLKSIFRERLQEIEREHQDGLLDDEQLQKAKLELERTLLNEVNASGEDINSGEYQVLSDWKTAGLIAVIVPAGAIGLYFHLGQPRIIDALEMLETHNAAMTREERLASVEQMVSSLASRLQDSPDDIDGWKMLARSYKALARYQEAASAYEHLYSLVDDDAGIILQYADTLAMTAGGSLSGKPAELIEKALELEPGNSVGLWLAGMVAREQGDNEAALGYWYRLLPQLQDEPESYQQLNQMIQVTERESGIAGNTGPQQAGEAGVSANSKGVTVNISLSSELTDRVKPDDVLFIFARATSGPPMPLAATRLTAGDLPLEITLDDSMAMMPNLKISGYDSVQVNARISMSGTPTESSGDLVAEAVTARPGQEQPVSLEIKSIVP